MRYLPAGTPPALLSDLVHRPRRHERCRMLTTRAFASTT